MRGIGIGWMIFYSIRFRVLGKILEFFFLVWFFRLGLGREGLGDIFFNYRVCDFFLF